MMNKAILRRIYLLTFIVLTCLSVESQPVTKPYPQKYFQWPVGAKIGLAANFGELRSNHYHMGLDCRTDQKVNMPIYAAADGFVSRVKIEPWGFGRAISIDHPNGFTTLYAHLNDFYPALEQYIKEQQYLLKRWDVLITIPPGMFTVKKGQFIAYSGNTGGSQGPHLHFEIRDTQTENVLNPLLFDFPVVDNIPPDILRLAVYDRRLSTYEQAPKIYPLRKINGVYKTSGPVTVNSNEVSFAITAYDRYTGSTNQNGIYSGEVYQNEELAGRFVMDNISYNDTRYLNAHIDYKTKSSGGPYLQHLSRLPGYKNGIYNETAGDGIVNLDNGAASIKIIAADANGNKSTLMFDIKSSYTSPVVTKSAGPVFYPDEVNIFDNGEVYLYLPENSIYDFFGFKYGKINNGAQSIYQIHNTSVPVQQYFPVMIKADFALKDTGKIMMKRFSGSKTDFKKAVFTNGYYKASFREFGNYQLILDTIPPVVIPIGITNGMNAAKLRSIRFSVTDNTEEIAQFNALLDGKWLRFSNDKGRNFVYDFDEHCPPGEHELIVTVEDLAGNKTEKKFRFTR